jgi:integrase
MPRKSLSIVPKKPGDYADPALPGGRFRVSATTGLVSYRAIARNPAGEQKYKSFPVTDETLDEVREQARAALKEIKAGAPTGTAADSFEVIADKWLDSLKAISVANIRREIGYAATAWAGRKFESVKRSDVVALLDTVAKTRGPCAADMLLSRLSSLMAWHAARSDDYVSPLFGKVKALRRVKAKEQARDRILNDDEIRKLWLAAEANGTFGAFIRICLLTGQRREAVAGMKWVEIDDADVWTIPQADRQKGRGGSLRLSRMAVEVIRSLPRLTGDYVFTGRHAGKPIAGYSKLKAKFDRDAGITMGWTIHDLRRTARSLMSRAGVSSDHAERVLGHAIGGVEGTYDRHAYTNEKAEALAKLAALIESIVRGVAAAKAA